MKEYFDKVKNQMEQSGEMTDNSDAYWLGYIHGLSAAGCLSDDEHTELVSLKGALHSQYRRAERGKRIIPRQIMAIELGTVAK